MPYGSIAADKITTSDGFTLGGSGATMKNRIINGAMVISQRNGTNTVAAPADGQYVLDRFGTFTNGGGVYSVAQSSVAPDGFTNSMLFTVTTADSSIAATDYYLFTQGIEGYNISDLGFGTASAKTVTMSFWVRSSVTGTFGFGLRQGSGARSYVAEYTISSANTWEQKTITIPGDTSGTWDKTNGAGMYCTWDLGSGSNRNATANTWSGGNYWRASGSTNLIATNGATLYITGVQLEVGSQATSFDYRQYGTELALCHRYYFDTASTTNGGSGSGLLGAFMFKAFNANEAAGRNSFPAPMRTSPTITCFDNAGATGKLHRFASGDVGTNISFGNLTQTGITAVSETGTFTTTEPNMYGGRIIASAEL